MSQPTNQELYTLLIHLEKKIDLLNARLNHISCGSSFIEIPQYTIYDWIENAKIESSYLTTLFTQNDGHLEAFKQFILSNHQTNKIPVLMDKELKTCIVDENDVNILTKMNEPILQKLIQDIWQKFMIFYRQQPNEDIIDDVRDIHMQKVMQMRLKLDNEKNRKIILKWLKEII
tara:strand:- start:1346 stop:1867 length:522 start_codon:yes stop_codon:yes gene_type:complete